MFNPDVRRKVIPKQRHVRQKRLVFYLKFKKPSLERLKMIEN